jgi:hypothetical protein
MERLSSLDAGFLHLETDRQQMHVGSLLLFEGPAPSFESFVTHIASCLALCGWTIRISPSPTTSGTRRSPHRAAMRNFVR